nr:hypothetical protein [Tanacetum cinerariifolium]GEZ91290.1 hypothetical protein [Tanacetum cinerariifolium]
MSTPTFYKTHNLIAYLAKPNESEEFEQIIDFFNGSSVSYVLTASLTIRTSCIMQFWTTKKVKTINDEVRIQTLIDEKRVNIKEYSIRHTLKLDDVEGTSCLASAEIFDSLVKMGYEKLSEKLTFYKAFFSPHNMTSAIICLATNKKFNFSRYILLSLVKNIEAGVPFFMFPRFVKLLIDHQLGDMSYHKDIYDNPSLTKKVFANMKRVGTGFSRVVTPLFNNMLPLPYNDPLPGGKDRLELKELIDLCTHLSNKVLELESEVINIKSTYKERIEKLEGRVDRIIEDIDEDVEINLEEAQAKPYRMDSEHLEKQQRPVFQGEEGVFVIQNLEETTSTVVVHLEVQSKDKGKVMKFQALKRKPLTEAQARKNMIIYLKNMAGYKMNYFKGMTYSEIRPLFGKHYNYNQAFLEEVNKEVTVPEKEVEVEGHKREEATPLASKIPIVDYKIHLERNKPYFKIIRADGNHMLFLSFSTLLKNFNREDLKSLWKLVKERFEKTEPKNYTDDYLLKTLKTMFKQPDVEASV